MLIISVWEVLLENACCDILFTFNVCTWIDVEVSLLNIDYWLINALTNHDIKTCWWKQGKKKMVIMFNIVAGKELMVHVDEYEL